MKSRIWGGLGLILTLIAAGVVCGQDCNCGSSAEGGHRCFWPGPYGGANCARDYNQAQAEALWDGYCTENCSLCSPGCGCGTGYGTAGAIGGGPFAGGPFAGLHSVRGGNAANFGSSSFSKSSFGGKSFGSQGNHGTSVLDRSVRDSGNSGWLGEIGGKGLGGSLFTSGNTGRRGGQSDAACDSGNSNTEAVKPSQQSALPTQFQRGKPAQPVSNRTVSELPQESGPEIGPSGN